MVFLRHRLQHLGRSRHNRNMRAEAQGIGPQHLRRITHGIKGNENGHHQMRAVTAQCLHPVGHRLDGGATDRIGAMGVTKIDHHPPPAEIGIHHRPVGPVDQPE